MFKFLDFKEIDSEESRAETPFSTYEVYQRKNKSWMPLVITHKERIKLAKRSDIITYEKAVKICNEHYHGLLEQCI